MTTPEFSEEVQRNLDLDLIANYIKAASKVYGRVLSHEEVEPDEGLIEEVGR